LSDETKEELKRIDQAQAEARARIANWPIGAARHSEQPQGGGTDLIERLRSYSGHLKGEREGFLLRYAADELEQLRAKLAERERAGQELCNKYVTVSNALDLRSDELATAQQKLAEMTDDYLRRHNDAVDHLEKRIAAETALAAAQQEIENLRWHNDRLQRGINFCQSEFEAETNTRDALAAMTRKCERMAGALEWISAHDAAANGLKGFAADLVDSLCNEARAALAEEPKG
jgi:hypothetical protein